MLLDDLLEASVVQLSESCQIVNISNDIAQVLLEQHEILLQGHIGLAAVGLVWGMLICLSYDIVDFLLTSPYSLDNLLALDLLECEDLVQFSFQFLDEALLILFGPWLPLGLGIVVSRFRLVVGVESFLQTFIVDVVVIPILDE
jgi:hypothetical protein